MERADLQRLASRLRTAGRITVLTGAGVSAASGVPTFRGTGGLWKSRRPEELATLEAFRRDPPGVWEWYAWRRAAVATCEPNPAHMVLARWSRELPGCRVITQNVDDLHLRAGTERLLRVHGSLWELSCLARCERGVVAWRDDDAASAVLRQCPHCGSMARPAVVWFGEPLDPDIVAQAVEATACDVFLTIGTSAVVYPAAGFVHEAGRRGAFTVEINPDATPASTAVALAIPEPAEFVLPALDALLLQ